MKIKDINESTVAGSIASVAMPMGEVQKREKPEKAPKVKKGRKFANTISEGAMKELLHNLKYMDANEFQKVYKKTKDFFQKTDKPAQTPAAPSSKSGSKVWHDTGYTDKKAAQKIDEPIKEDELNEEDLIILPGMLRGKDKSFISKEHDRRDHEVEMARSDLYAAAKNAMRIFQLLKNRTEDEGLMGWQQSYITLAADYLNSVADSIEYNQVADEGVIAGGMSNFEESRYGRYYDPMGNERREQDAMDADRRRFKHDELSAELSGEEEASRRANEGPWYVRIDGKLVRDKNKDPYVFNTLEAARKAAQTMMKKDWNKGKQFSMTRSTTEGMSAAVKLQRAFKDAQQQSAASRKRGQEELENARKEYDKKQADEKNKKDVTEEKCNECGGVAYADESIAEEKDACYNKVKSRYKVWPSAYASGALSKCRKVGAKNWGNKSKK